MSREIVHLCVLEKFIPPFIELVRDNFGLEGHLFLVSGRGDGFSLPKDAHVVRLRTIMDRLVQLKALYDAEKIILHGLYDAKFLYLLALQPWLLKKCHWMIWGDDLYQYLDKRTTLKRRFKEKVRAFVIRRLGGLISYIKGDCDLARDWYGSGAKHFDCLMYLSNVHSPIPDLPPRTSDRLVIQLGNSAYPRNRHGEFLERLAPYKEERIEVYAPLSYGPKAHALEVAEQGRALLGDRFIPLFNFMKPDQYLEFLAKIDIAVFNNIRQQAMGNIISLLGMGKTVYLRRTTTTLPLMESIGVKVMDAEQFDLRILTDEERVGNIEAIRRHFSKERLVTQLGALFSREPP